MDRGFVDGLFCGGKDAVGVGVEGRAGDAEGVQEEDERVAGGVGAEVG